METLHTWLLHNMGNQGNYFTILNMHQPNPEDAATLDVMARTKDASVVNLLIYAPTDGHRSEPEPDTLKARKPMNRYYFADEQQVIAFLTDGATTESASETEATGIGVLVLEPANETDQVIFPPQ